MTQAELDAAIARWQERLCLRDWTIIGRVKRVWEMTAGKGGEIEINLNTHTAWLDYLDPGDRLPEWAHLNDGETIVVHELLHILTEPLSIAAEGLEHHAHEWLIECVARALVALDRERQEKANG